MRRSLVLSTSVLGTLVWRSEASTSVLGTPVWRSESRELFSELQYTRERAARVAECMSCSLSVHRQEVVEQEVAQTRSCSLAITAPTLSASIITMAAAVYFNERFIQLDIFIFENINWFCTA